MRENIPAEGGSVDLSEGEPPPLVEVFDVEEVIVDVLERRVTGLVLFVHFREGRARRVLARVWCCVGVSRLGLEVRPKGKPSK
jgi:hypothetical protein